MTIETLSKFLASLSKPFGVLDGGNGSSTQLRDLAAALEPFSTHDIPDFIAFLHKADGYLKTGAVAPDPVGVAELRHAVEAVHAAVQTQNSQDQLGDLQGRLAEAITSLGESVGLKGPKLKADPKWIENVRSRADADAAVKKMKALAARIETVESLTEESVRQEIDDLAGLSPAVMKVVAGEAGVKATAKSKPRDLVVAILAAMTKLPLGAKPKGGKAKGGKAKAGGADDGTILQITSELKAMAVRATNPEAVSDAEIEEMLTKVEASGFSDPQLKEIAFAVTGVKEKSKGKALLALRGKLTAAKRGLEGTKI